MLNEDRQKFFRDRWKSGSISEPDTYCMYGTHYSNPTVVLTYLMRMEPFTSLHFY